MPRSILFISGQLDNAVVALTKVGFNGKYSVHGKSCEYNSYCGFLLPFNKKLLIRLLEVNAVCVLNLHIHLSISNFRNALFKLITN